MSESLRRELLLFGIDVIVIGPGAVATPIWSKAEQVDTTPSRNTPYAPALDRLRSYMLTLGEKGLPPEQIGEAVLYALTAAKPSALRRFTAAHAGLSGAQDAQAARRSLIGGRLGLLPESSATTSAGDPPELHHHDQNSS